MINFMLKVNIHPMWFDQLHKDPDKIIINLQDFKEEDLILRLHYH
jgi:hypothetical protein